MVIQAYGVFEGGGAKGLAHIGALKQAEQREIKFIGVAGTSAGSIIAALIAAGYTADELYVWRKPDVGVFRQNLYEAIETIEDIFGGGSD